MQKYMIYANFLQVDELDKAEWTPLMRIGTLSLSILTTIKTQINP